MIAVKVLSTSDQIMRIGEKKMPEQIENRIVVDSEWEQHERKSKKICSCDECGEDIYPGEIYYKIDGDCICEECLVMYMNKHYKVEAYED